MPTPTPLIDADGEVRELTAADMAQFRPAHTVLPAALQATLGMRRRGPQKTPTKTATTVRLDTDILNAFRQSGKGWQTRLNAVLREAMAADLELGRDQVSVKATTSERLGFTGRGEGIAAQAVCLLVRQDGV